MRSLSRAQAKALFQKSAKPRRPRTNPEEQLQIAVAEYLALAAPDLMWFHVPNGEKRSKATAGRLKAMGVRAGVPDLCFILPGGASAFIELKAGKGRLTSEQVAFFDAIPVEVPRAVCRSVEDVAAALMSWGVSLRRVQVGRAA
jgi:hypothetical protein